MDYTLEKLIDILRKRLQDEEFDAGILTTFINDAINEILGEDKFPFMQRIDKYIAEPFGEISLPPAYAGTLYIYANSKCQPREELRFISPERFFDNTKQHVMVYTTFANTLFYRFRKDSKCDGCMITHLYIENPRPLVKDTDRPQIPPQYMETVILGALARAEQVRDNFDMAQIFQNQQDLLLTNMKMRYGPGNLSAKNRAKLPSFGGYCDDRI